jgi:hypothetical protein
MHTMIWGPLGSAHEPPPPPGGGGGGGGGAAGVLKTCVKLPGLVVSPSLARERQ